MATPAYEIPLFKIGTLLAGADLTGKQFCFVALHTDGTVVMPATGTGQKVLGVLQNKPNTGEACEIMVIGVTALKADGVGLTAGDGIEAVITTGLAQTAAGAGTNVVGTCLQTAAASAVFTALINCGTAYIAS